MAYRNWRLAWPIGVVVLALAQPGTLTGTDVEGDRRPPGFVRLISIADESGTVLARALNAVDWYEDRRIQRVLIRTPGGDHVILTESDFPLAGKTRREILVEETGWWLSVEEQSGIKFGSVQEAADPGAVAGRYIDGEKPRTIVIDAAGLVEPVEHSSTTWDDRFLDDLFLILTSQLRRESLVRGMEPQTQDALEFICSWTSCERCAFPMVGIVPVMEYLLAVVKGEPGTHGVLPQEALQLKAEFSVRAGEKLSLEARTLAGEFETVRPDDLLLGLRPEEE